jgi:alpha-mannosidase
MIAQAHLDPVWLWRWTEGQAEALATSQSALDRLAEYPALHFTRGEAQVYEWIEDENPVMFQAIRQRISQDRWHLVNGMVIQPDMNLPQGESFVRQALLGKGYFWRRFGQEVKVAYCVDSFGHAGTLPQILKKCGFEHYVFMRPQEHEKDLPPQAFWWQGPDDSRLLAFRISRSYASGGDDLLPLIEAALSDRPPSLSDVACFFGVGNHGGGPTKQQIDQLVELDAHREDVTIQSSSLQAYFDAIQPQAHALPVVAEELQFHAVGCYSVNSRLKRLHRQAECALLQAERMAVLAELWTAVPADRSRFHELWHDLCFNQFHDILAGTCIKEAQDESEMALERVLLTARQDINRSGRLIGEHVDTSGAGGVVLLFNTSPEPLQSYIEYEPWTGWQSWQENGWGLVDDQNQPVAHQLIEAKPATGGGFTRLLFQTRLPPMGYRLYRFDQGLPLLEAPVKAWSVENGLENDHLRLTLDPRSGNIISCLDKKSGLDLVGPAGWNVPQVIADPSDTWSHGVRCFDQVLGQFGAPTIRVAEQGPLQASLFVERSWEEKDVQGSWQQQVILRAGEPEVILRNWLHWRGGWHTLKLAFDALLDEPQALRDVPFGALPFPPGLETPMQMWASVHGFATGRKAGLAVLNDGKYGVDLTGATLRLTVLRSPPYGYHVPHRVGSKQRYDWIDQGFQEFTLILRPFVGDWQAAGIDHQARQLNLPLEPVTMHTHPGVLPGYMSLCRLEGEGLELTALKPAEGGQGYIIRIADRYGQGEQGTLTWQGQDFPLVCKPYEVNAFRLVLHAGRWNMQPCDFLERLV